MQNTYTFALDITPRGSRREADGDVSVNLRGFKSPLNSLFATPAAHFGAAIDDTWKNLSGQGNPQQQDFASSLHPLGSATLPPGEQGDDTTKG